MAVILAASSYIGKTGSTIYCSNFLFSTMSTVFPSLCVGAVIEVTSGTIFFVLLRINKRKQDTIVIDRAQHTLAVRDQQKYV